MADLKDLENHIEILRAIKRRRRELDEIEKISRELVEDALGNDDTGLIDGEVVATYKPYKQRRLNQRLLKAKLPEVYELYCETTESRRFTIIEEGQQ